MYKGVLAGLLASGQRNPARSLVFDGLTRTYHVHVPPSYDGKRPMPLVLVFHGLGGDGPGMVFLTHFDSIADQQGCIVVYPDGLNRRWSFGKQRLLGGVDDVGFVAALIEALARELNIDRQRIYATGISNGGFFSELLACQRADIFAAIAMVAATTSRLMSLTCRPSRPVPIMLIHGTHDPLIPFESRRPRPFLLSVPASIRHWAALNGCSAAPVVTDLPDRVSDGTHIRCETYSGPRSGAEVILYVIEGGGHTWPGGIQYLPERMIGKTSRQMDASQVIWDFFQRHPKI